MRAIDYQKFNEGSIEMCFFFSSPRDRVPKKNTEKCARATCWSIRGPATHRTVFKYLMWFFFLSFISQQIRRTHKRASMEFAALRNLIQFTWRAALSSSGPTLPAATTKNFSFACKSTQATFHTRFSQYVLLYALFFALLFFFFAWQFN